MKTPLRIAAVGFALTMIGGYVVYSQWQAQRAEGPAPASVAPSSKLKAPLVTVQQVQSGRSSSAPARVQTGSMVAPGSKSLAPIVTARPSPPVITSNASPARLMAPGSKSAPIVHLTPEQAAKVTGIQALAIPATNRPPARRIVP